MEEEPIEIRAVARAVGRAVNRGNRFMLRYEKLRGVDFSGRQYDSVGIYNSTLIGCNFSGLRVRDSFTPGARNRRWFRYRARPSLFVDCVFDGAKMNLGPGGSARFERCSFRDVTLHEWLWDDVELVECIFSGRLSKAIIWGTSQDLERRAVRTLDVIDNDFSDMDFDDVGFRGGVDLTRQRLPRDPRYVFVADARDVLPLVRAAVCTWTCDALRQDADAILETLQSDVDGGQTQIFFDVHGWGRELRTASERLADLMVLHGGIREAG